LVLLGILAIIATATSSPPEPIGLDREGSNFRDCERDNLKETL